MDRLQGQGSPTLRRKHSYNNNNNTQQIYHNMIGQRHAIITITTIFLAIVLIANNNASNLQNNNRSETTNTILFDNSIDNKQLPLSSPSYSILPKKIYSVVGLESSGTQFVSKLIEDALHTGPYREGSRPCIETCNDKTPKCENMKQISEQHSCNESSDILVQHFSLPWGGSCHFHPDPPIVDVVLPSQCTRDQVNQTETEECNAMTRDIWGLELNGKPFQYPTRYQLDITANKKWFDAQGVEQYFIIVIRDAKISYLARHSHCNSTHLRKQEEEVGTQLIMEAINTFILQDVNEEVTNKTIYQWVASQYQEHRNGRMLSALPSRNNVVVVSYESLVKLGGTYVKMLYDALGIDSDIIPDIRDSNEKYLNKTLQQDQPKLPTNKEDDSAPRIAWLMSFPNSGTTYTKHLVDMVSGYNTASNYDDGLSHGGTKTPIWDKLSNGPFYSASSNQNWTKTPTGFVLTKTHCGSYCLWCRSTEYISTAAQFSRSCGRTSHVPQGDNKPKIGHYNITLAKRAVHIIRDPFSNIVARFHHHIKSLAHQNETNSYTLDEKGFRTMCSELDAKLKEDIASSPFFRDVKDLVKVIPCSSDFYRWTQWHNLAHITTYDLGIPTLIIHYENYTHNFNQTVDILHNFLRLDMKNEPPLFITGKTYRDYYTKEERTAVKEMVEKLATKKIWENVHHYFE